MDLDVTGVAQSAATGHLPPTAQIDELLGRAHARAAAHHEGEVADYIPLLATADPEAFGLCLADVDGGLHEQGDTRIEFSIQSISKAFVYALVGLLILGGVSALAILPASRLPSYRPEEVPDPSPTR